MFSIRRRWPFVAAAVAALLYMVNNYSISGLEHLKIKPVASSAPEAPATIGDNGVVGTGNGTFNLSQFNIQGRSSPANASWDELQDRSSQTQSAWDHLLSAGEKLAVWQGKLAPEASRASADNAYAGPSLSVSSPIPAPLGLSRPIVSGAGPIGSQAVPKGFSDTGSMKFSTGELPLLLPLGSPAVNPPPSSDAPISDVSSLTAGTGHTLAAAPFAQSTIRVATFKVPGMGPATLASPHTLQTLVAILQHFDVVALQGLQTTRDDVLPLLIEQLNSDGGSYDYLIGPRVGRSTNRQQFAVLFDTRKLETDRYQLYTVDDPQDLVTYEPLVAWFRCKGVPPQDAFTFSLIDVAVEPSFADSERGLLPNMIAAIEKDGRHEDDWILVGDLAGGPAELTMLESSRIRFAVRDVPTDVSGTRSLDAILFSVPATTEFTGRAGVFDFLRKYNLSIERATEVSSRLPVWAEFACLEGAQPGRVAPPDPQTIY